MINIMMIVRNPASGSIWLKFTETRCTKGYKANKNGKRGALVKIFFNMFSSRVSK
jgi:hypothetical protein